MNGAARRSIRSFRPSAHSCFDIGLQNGRDHGVVGARLRGRGVQARALDARRAAGRVLLGVRVHTEAKEGNAPPHGCKLMMGPEVLLSVGVDAALMASLTLSCA